MNKKVLSLLLVFCLLLTGLVGCTKPETPANDQPADDGTSQTPENPQDNDSEDLPETPDDPEIPDDPAPAGPQPMDLVGTWQRTHTEVEGDRNENTKATLTISGDAQDSLTITYKDMEFPDSNFKDKALTVEAGELYTDCGNDAWIAKVASTGKYTYAVTLLEDGTVILQCYFEIDDMPMVSYQWFAKSQ